MSDIQKLEDRVMEIKADKSLNRKGRRVAIKDAECAGSTARKARQVEVRKEQRKQIQDRVARKVEIAQARKAAIEKSKNPSRFTLIKRRVFAMRDQAKREHAERYARKMERKNHAN